MKQFKKQYYIEVYGKTAGDNAFFMDIRDLVKYFPTKKEAIKVAKEIVKDKGKYSEIKVELHCITYERMITGTSRFIKTINS